MVEMLIRVRTFRAEFRKRIANNENIPLAGLIK